MFITQCTLLGPYLRTFSDILVLICSFLFWKIRVSSNCASSSKNALHLKWPIFIDFSTKHFVLMWVVPQRSLLFRFLILIWSLPCFVSGPYVVLIFLCFVLVFVYWVHWIPSWWYPVKIDFQDSRPWPWIPHSIGRHKRKDPDFLSDSGSCGYDMWVSNCRYVHIQNLQVFVIKICLLKTTNIFLTTIPYKFYCGIFFISI